MDSGEPPPQSKFQAPTEFPSLAGVKNQPSPSTVLVKAPLDVDVDVSITGGSVLASSGLVQGGGSVSTISGSVQGDNIVAAGSSPSVGYGLIRGGSSVTAGSPIAAVPDSVRGRESVAAGGPISVVDDQERNDEIPSNVPSEATAYNTNANVSTLQITHSASMETEAVPPISSPANNSAAISASPSDLVCVLETTQLNTDSGFNGNITTSNSVSPSSSAPLLFATAGTLSLSTPVVDLKCKSSVDGLRDSCLQLSDAKGSNRFANLAMLEEDVQLDVVTSPSQSLSPLVETNTQFFFNSSLPSTPSSFSDPFVDNVVATSSDSFDMAQRSRGGRCLKPSQKLKVMEWCTISGKGRRGRGTTPYGRRSH
ncbi:hypothetical protein F2Q69_00004383 [Brassica cretica]|uniref:Uncharacterized protein n=1 Tax=Brassica cretica TaxID=69181 RepID=A0A8S9NYA2_BRACR|nr:hypothetical protein F2Q69_00004383 [Brassica cretica]